jgi:opacity protein-like surface antigen
MRRVSFLFAAGAASLLGTAALAADLSIAPPPMMYAPPAYDFGGWYLRGDIGFSNQSVKNLRYGRESAYTGLTSFSQQSSFDTGNIFGVGVGYQFNNWFRADVTGQYRGSANFKATDLFTGTAFGLPYNGIDNYNATKSEWVVMGNIYADLGTWYGVTPFIGAGVGTANVRFANFTDTGINNLPFSTASFASAPSASKWNFAWALHAGLGYRVTPGMTVELAYSYMNLGTGQTGVLSTFTGTTTNNVFYFKDITSHDVKLGVRWSLDAGPVYAPQPPIIRKG